MKMAANYNFILNMKITNSKWNYMIVISHCEWNLASTISHLFAMRALLNTNFIL